MMAHQHLPKSLMTELAETSLAWYDRYKALQQEEDRAMKAKRLFECQCLERKMAEIQRRCTAYRASM